MIVATTWNQNYGSDATAKGSKNVHETALYKSTDEGLTWTKLQVKGIPKLEGRMCVAVAQNTQSKRVFLIGTFGFFRSDDGGSNWTQMAAGDRRIANGQGYYTSGVYVDTENPDVIYTLATCVYRSTNGGKTFEGFKGAPGGDDPQQLWIDPTNHNHILYGGDQGATVSLDAGKTWGSWYNQPTGQFYHISTDTQFPYWIYGTQQDSGCIGTSSRGNLGAITPMDWTPHPGNEGGYIVTDPLNPKVSFAVGPVGGIIRVTMPSGQWVQVEPSADGGDFSGGNGQLAFNPTNPHELLSTSQHFLIGTTDSGGHWRKLSPDLVTDPNAKTAAEKQQNEYGTISIFSASPVKPGLIWVATGTGFIWLTQDHGKTWNNVTPPARPGGRRGYFSSLVASGTTPGMAIAVILTPGSNGQRRHLIRTVDFGQSWTEVADSPQSDKTLAEGVSGIISDTKKAGLLFARPGSHVAYSIDNGDTWQDLTLNLPKTELSDLLIHGNDLVLATYGRGIWILDDISPLREITTKTFQEPSHLFKPADAYRVLRNVNGDTPFPPEVPHADNPPLGAVIYYSLAHRPSSDIRLEILDSRGRLVRHYSSLPTAPYDDPPPLVPDFWKEVIRPLPTDVGLNRVNWNVRYDTPTAFNHDVSDVMGANPGTTPAAVEGPLAKPGVYTARLTVDGQTSSQTFVIRNDPRSTATRREIDANSDLRMKIYLAALESADGYFQVKALRSDVATLLATKPVAEVAKSAKELDTALEAVAGVATHERRFYGPPPPTSFVNINGYLLTRLDNYDYGDIVPTEAMQFAFGSDWAKLKVINDQWRATQKKELAALNKLLAKNGLKPLALTGKALLDPPAPDKKYLPAPVDKSKSKVVPGAVVTAVPVG